METQSDSADARRALDEIARVRSQSAVRRRTPWWLWQLIGLAMFVMIAGLALPSGWRTVIPVVALGVLLVALGVFRNRSGFALFERDRRARLIGFVGLAIDIAALIIALSVRSAVGDWALVAAGAVWYLDVLILGSAAERGIDEPTRPVS